MIIVLASHSKLAWGMKEALEFFGAPVEPIILEQTAEETDFEVKAEEMLKEHQGEDVVVFTDILGGSVNQIFSKLLQKYSFKLITGMNLALLLACSLTGDAIDDEFIRETCAEAREQLCYMNDVLGVSSK